MKYTTFSNVIWGPLIYTPKSNSHNKYVEIEIEKEEIDLRLATRRLIRKKPK